MVRHIRQKETSVLALRQTSRYKILALKSTLCRKLNASRVSRGTLESIVDKTRRPKERNVSRINKRCLPDGELVVGLVHVDTDGPANVFDKLPRRSCRTSVALHPRPPQCWWCARRRRFPLGCARPCAAGAFRQAPRHPISSTYTFDRQLVCSTAQRCATELSKVPTAPKGSPGRRSSSNTDHFRSHEGRGGPRRALCWRRSRSCYVK
jgi:hypothetical protein